MKRSLPAADRFRLVKTRSEFVMPGSGLTLSDLDNILLVEKGSYLLN